MADHLTADFFQNIKQFSLFHTDPNSEVGNHQFADQMNMNPSFPESLSIDFQSLMGIPLENFFPQVPEFPGNLAEIYPGDLREDQKNVVPVANQDLSAPGNESADQIQDQEECKKRKMSEAPESSSANSSTPVSDQTKRIASSTRRKRAKKQEKEEEEKPKDVVHVRARRGQATDSHSLAERVRRSKINERLRCLQDIVPGCYKTMGMAGMLDEIINYVQSLQNQVEFLSMKLTAASSYYDFNSDTDIIERMQRAKASGALRLQKQGRDICEGFGPSSQIGPLGVDFGCYPSLPYNTNT